MLTRGEKKLDFLDWKTKQVNRRSKREGGGVSISIDTKRLEKDNNFKISSPDFKTNETETTFIEIKYKDNNKPTLIGSIYVNPDRNEFRQKIEELKLYVQNFIFSN